MIALFAIPFYVGVPDGDVADGYEYGNPAAVTTGSNTTLSPSLDPPLLDKGAAGLWGLLQPALSAVDMNVSVPGYGPGTAELIDVEPVVVGRGSKPVPQTTCAFQGENRELLIVPVDNDGNQLNAGTDTLKYVAESPDGTDVQVTVIAPQNPATGEITIPTMAPGVNTVPGNYNWSVRSSGTGIVVAYGTHETEPMAVGGNPMPVDGEQLSDGAGTSLPESDVRLGVEYGNGKTGTLDPSCCDGKCQTLNFFVGAESPVQIDLPERKGRMVRLLIYSVDVKVFESASVIVGEDGKADFVIGVPDVGNLQFNGLPPYASFGYHVLDRITGQTIKRGDAQGFQHHT